MANASTLQIARSDDGHIVRVVGHGTLRESPAVREIIRLWLDRYPGVVFVDLTQCSYLDSTFMGCLIEMHKRANEVEPTRLWLAADRFKSLQLFSSTTLDRLFHFTDESPQPVGEWVPLEAQQVDSHDLGWHVMHCHRSLAEFGGKDSSKFAAIADRLEDELRHR